MPRITRINLHNTVFVLQAEYAKITNALLSYSGFRNRLKTYESKLTSVSNTYNDKSIFYKAATYPQSKWMKVIGVGRAEKFVYKGSKYPLYRSASFISMPYFLDVIGRLSKHKLVRGRLKQQ